MGEGWDQRHTSSIPNDFDGWLLEKGLSTGPPGIKQCIQRRAICGNELLKWSVTEDCVLYYVYKYKQVLRIARRIQASFQSPE
jgi:hypothetical protein